MSPMGLSQGRGDPRSCRDPVGRGPGGVSVGVGLPLELGVRPSLLGFYYSICKMG